MCKKSTNSTVYTTDVKKTIEKIIFCTGVAQPPIYTLRHKRVTNFLRNENDKKKESKRAKEVFLLD